MSIKRFSSLFLAIAFMLNMFAVLPIEAFAVTEDSHVYEKDGYTVTYRIGSEWDNNRSVEVTIKNTGEESILNWALKYDVGGEVYSPWNSMVYSEDEDGTVIKNNGYNYEIEPGQSANYGYIVTGAETLIPEDIELCSRRIDVKSGYEVDFNITNDWYTGFQAEVSIKNTSFESIEAWTLLFEGNFDIVDIWNSKLLSSENRSYEVANQLWTTPIKAGESASFGFTANKSATENAETSNYQLTAVVIGESIFEYPNIDDIDFELDTDEDGLHDYYEDIIGTDKNNADTDGDGLSDYYEIFYFGTDPLKSDSDDNGINDGNEDNDKDGLSNAEELELGTDPNNDDTDGDGLSDGAEVNTHGTDPLKYDTDDDGVSDGDEITLGLNPNSSSTNGIPDNERTFVQTVNAESEVLSAINGDESVPFNVSLEIKAAGVAEKNLSAYESGYSAVMQNDAVIGIIPQFSYINGLSVEEVKVKFELENSITSNTLGTFADESNEFTGIKRLNIFKYFEDINMLLPVETFHDTNNNVVYTVTDCLGTYCLMDMEIWLDSLGISLTSEKAEVEESEAMSQNSLDNDNYMCYNVSELKARSNSDEFKDNINVVFIIDTRESQEKLDNVKKEILDVSRVVLKKSSNGRIYIFEQHTELSPNNRYKVYSSKGNRFFTNYNDLSEVISEIKTNGSVYNDAILSDSLEGVLSVCDLSRETYVFSLFNQENVVYRENNGYSLLDDAVKRNVDISVIAEIDNSKKYGYAHDMYKKSGGIFVVDTESNYSPTVLSHIYGKKVENTSEYNMILATGLTSVKLLAPITEEYAMLASAGEIDETQPDTDKDGLPDYMEINFKAKDSDGVNLIEFENGVVDLPKYSRCISCKSELTYVKDGLYRFDGQVITDTRFIDYLDNCGLRVLPIVSDPTSEDGDGDGLLDAGVTKRYSSIIAPQDPNPLCKDGPDGLWVEHIRNAKRNDIPHKLGDWYGDYHINENERKIHQIKANLFGYIIAYGINFIDGVEGVEGLKNELEGNRYMRHELESLLHLFSDNESILNDETMLNFLSQVDFDNGFDIYSENSGYEGFYYFMCELKYLKKEGKVDFNIQDVIDMIVLIKGFVESVEENGTDIIHEEVMKILNVLKSWVKVESEDEKNRILASFGSRLCNFKADEFGNTIHSQFYSWEYIGGYNDLFDNLLGTFTEYNTRKVKFDFESSSSDKDYILWAWKGDYLGLGAGAEIGIYSRNKDQSSSNNKLDHYNSDYNLKKPMKLYLYEYNSGTDIKNVFSWEPYEYQWWITGFNAEYVNKVDVKKQVMVGSVDFNDNKDMFNGLYEEYENENENEYKGKYLIFDKINYIVWICWFEEDLI